MFASIELTSPPLFEMLTKGQRSVKNNNDILAFNQALALIVMNCFSSVKHYYQLHIPREHGVGYS